MNCARLSKEACQGELKVIPENLVFCLYLVTSEKRLSGPSIIGGIHSASREISGVDARTSAACYSAILLRRVPIASGQPEALERETR